MRSRPSPFTSPKKPLSQCGHIAALEPPILSYPPRSRRCSRPRSRSRSRLQRPHSSPPKPPPYTSGGGQLYIPLCVDATLCTPWALISHILVVLTCPRRGRVPWLPRAPCRAAGTHRTPPGRSGPFVVLGEQRRRVAACAEVIFIPTASIARKREDVLLRHDLQY